MNSRDLEEEKEEEEETLYLMASLQVSLRQVIMQVLAVTLPWPQTTRRDDRDFWNDRSPS